MILELIFWKSVVLEIKKTLGTLEKYLLLSANKMIKISRSALCHFVRVPLRRSFASTANAAKTALYDLHLKHGGKMVVFADHLMPILYKQQTIIESHLHTRSAASIFDVSHMLQTSVTGRTP